MKILIVLKNFNQRKGLPGGVGNANEELGKELKKLGHEIDFISRENETKKGSFLNSFFELRKRIFEQDKKEHYDIIYTQDWSLTLPLLFPYRILKKKHFSCFCGHQENFLIIIQNLIGKRMGKKLVVIGDELKKRFPNASLLYRGVNFEKFKPLGKKRDGIGWVEKGTEKLVLSEENLEKLAKKNSLKLYIARKIPSHKMNSFYNKCRIFISLPLRAGYNNVWNESMAAGVPIVIGNGEGGGTMLPINKVNMKENVYNQIDKIINNQKKVDYRKWLKERGFSWEEKAKELIKIFNEKKNV